MAVVSCDIFPWSVIIPQLERQQKQECAAEFEAAKNDMAAMIIDMWQCMVYSTCYHMRRENDIKYFTEKVGEILTKILGTETARAMVLQAMTAESTTKDYITLTTTAWQPGGRAWRYYMFLAGCCMLTIDNALSLWGRVPPTQLWRRRLEEEYGGFGHRWLKECMIKSGFDGELKAPDDDSTSWREGVTQEWW